jgi:hypothetical protein
VIGSILRKTLCSAVEGAEEGESVIYFLDLCLWKFDQRTAGLIAARPIIRVLNF